MIKKRGKVHCDLFIRLLLLSTPTIWFSLEHKRRSRKRSRKKWKRSDSSDSHSVVLITQITPLMTSIFLCSLGHKRRR